MTSTARILAGLAAAARCIVPAVFALALVACGATDAPPQGAEPVAGPVEQPVPRNSTGAAVAPISTVGPPPTFVVNVPTAIPRRRAEPTIEPTAIQPPTPEPTASPVPSQSAPATEAEASLETEQVRVERAAVAYSYCNGLYFGVDVENRYDQTMNQIEKGTRTVEEVEEHVVNLCNGNFNNPRVRVGQPTSTPIPTRTPDPRKEDATAAERRLYLLHLLNIHRQDHDLPPLQRSINPVAHEHASHARNHCYASLWQLSGESVYHLYHQRGGFQNVAAWHSGHSRCTSKPPDEWPTWQEEAAALATTIAEAPSSPLRDPGNTQVAIGMAWTPYQRWNTVVFESDRIDFAGGDATSGQGDNLARWSMRETQIKRGTALTTGRLTGDAVEADRESLLIRVYHAPGPSELTRGQAHAARLQQPGNLIAVGVSPPLTAGAITTPFLPTTPECKSARAAEREERMLPPKDWITCRGAWLTPYDIPRQEPDAAPTPTSSVSQRSTTVKLPGIPIQVRRMTSRELSIVRVKEDAAGILTATLNIVDLQRTHGTGVYTFEVWAEINATPQIITSASAAYETGQ